MSNLVFLIKVHKCPSLIKTKWKPDEKAGFPHCPVPQHCALHTPKHLCYCCWRQSSFVADHRRLLLPPGPADHNLITCICQLASDVCWITNCPPNYSVYLIFQMSIYLLVESYCIRSKTATVQLRHMFVTPAPFLIRASSSLLAQHHGLEHLSNSQLRNVLLISKNLHYLKIIINLFKLKCILVHQDQLIKAPQ